MSHFSVGVIFDQFPTPELLTETLQPWHEYECTGHDDQYVQDVDETENYLKALETRVWVYKDDADELDYCLEHSKDEHPEAKETSRREYLEQIGEDPMKWLAEYHGKEIVHSMDEVDKTGEHKYGYMLVENGKLTKAIDRTNPNKRWDWWSVGGRWSGLLTPKDRDEPHLQGETSAFGTRFNEDGVDICRLGNLDHEAMKKIKQDKCRAGLEKGLSDLEKKGMPRERALKLWAGAANAIRSGMRDRFEATRNPGETYFDWIGRSDDAAAVAYREARDAGVISALGDWGAGVDNDQPDPEAWVESQVSLTLWALVVKGGWHEKGEMGWFSMSSGDKTEQDWRNFCQDTLTKADESHWLVIVDCHI